MGSLDRIARRIALYRACLQRDAELGVIPPAGRAPVDDCLAAIEQVLEAARVELEGAGALEADDAFARRFERRCGELAARLFAGVYGAAATREAELGLDVAAGSPGATGLPDSNRRQSCPSFIEARRG